MPDLTANPPPSESSSKWRAMPAIDRRIFGVLIEKGKTTPDQYPMSLNALTAGCNQKSNRYPQMDLDQEDVLRGLDRLRMLGAVAEVQGGGRVPRYRHFAYEWLGVNKVELAVMAELLLRGSQSEGELRGRAARMEPIADVAALRPVLDSLESKRLVVSLSSPGRGHMVTHNLYEPQEMEKQRTLHGGGEHDEADWETGRGGERESGRVGDAETGRTVASASVASPRDASFTRGAAEDSHSLEKELQLLRSEIAQVKVELAELTASHERMTDELRSMRDALGG